MSSKKEVRKPYVGVSLDADVMRRLIDYKKKKEKALGVELRLAQVLRSIIEKEV